MLSRFFKTRRSTTAETRKVACRRLRLEPLEGRSLLAPIGTIVDIAPDPRNQAVQAEVRFTDSVSGLATDVTGVDLADFTLTRDSASVDLSTASISGSGSTYTLDLTSVTGQAGTYQLTLVAAGSNIEDSGNVPLAADDSDSWVTETTAPTATIGTVTPDPRNTAVGTLPVNFDESVTGVNIADFKLTRNGANVALTAGMLTGSGASYSLNLATVTATPGQYLLTLTAAGSGIVDTSGNVLTANAAASWTNEATAPTADIIDVTPDPRLSPVGNVTIVFSEAVTGVDIADFRLVRNGTNIALTGLTVSGSGTTYTVNLATVTTDFGDYTFTLVASGSGIADTAGNALLANASDTWSIDDNREQNDTLQTASELGRIGRPVAVNSLVLFDSNDWFRFTTTKVCTAKDNVKIVFNNALGNLDLELYSVSGQRLRASLGNTGTETVSLSGLKVGTYFIRVFGKNGATNPNYSLAVNIGGSAVIRTTPQLSTTGPAVRSAAATDTIFADLGTPTTSTVRKIAVR